MSFLKINISKSRAWRPNVCGQLVKSSCKQENVVQQLLINMRVEQKLLYLYICIQVRMQHVQSA